MIAARRRALACTGLLLATCLTPLEAQVPAAGAAPGAVAAAPRPQESPARRAGTRLLLGYAANFPRQPVGGALLLLREGLGLYADARTTVPDPGFSVEVPVVSAGTLTPAPGHEKDLRYVYRSWSAGLTLARARWGGYAAATRVRRRVYMLTNDDVGIFSETGQIWGEDIGRRRVQWAAQAGVIRELAPGAFVFLGAQSAPPGGTFGFALALNGR